jgi:chromosome segregation ATPase
MTLTQEDIDFIKANMADWLIEQSLGKPTAVYEIELRERMVRVEEELKHQRELMQQGFAQTERRFEQADQRDRELRQDMLERFEQVDKRFEQVDRRFQQVDQHLEQMGQRFSAIDSRFDEMIRRHDRHFLWLIGFISTVGTLIVAAGKLL